MEEKSISTNVLPALVLTGALGGSLIAGILTEGHFALVVYLYPILYFIFYFVTKANHVSFPLYFFIAMFFMNGNTGSFSAIPLSVTIVIQVTVVVIAVLASLLPSIKKGLPWTPSCGIWNSIKAKYRRMLSNDPNMTLRITVHCLILFIAGFTGFLLQDYRGKWVLLSCGAVLIGDELPVLTKRGRNFCFGITIGCCIAALIGFFQIPKTVRMCLIIPLLIVIFCFMPKVPKRPNCYIPGSAFVAVLVMIGDSLSQDILTFDIVVERFIWGMLGMAIALVATHLIDLVSKEVYATAQLE